MNESIDKKTDSSETVEPSEKVNAPKQDMPEQVASEKNSEEKIHELTELVQRTQANFENYRKQQEKRVQEFSKMAGKGFVLQLLPIIDYFELALKTINSTSRELEKSTVHVQEFVKGMELIYAQLKSLLEENNVKEIETTGKKYDPYVHEALMRVESEKPADQIIEEFQKGYTLHEQVIRHAKVKISAGKKVNESQQK